MSLLLEGQVLSHQSVISAGFSMKAQPDPVLSLGRKLPRLREGALALGGRLASALRLPLARFLSGRSSGGSVVVKNAYGFLPGNEYHKMPFYGWPSPLSKDKGKPPFSLFSPLFALSAKASDLVCSYAALGKPGWQVGD